MAAALQKLRLGAAPEDLLHEVTHTLTNKLIHPPSARLNKYEGSQQDELLRAVRDLYNLAPDDLQSGDEE